MANVTSDDLWKYLNNCNVDVDAKLYGDLLCVICKKIMQNAYQGPCGCKYCHKCIDSYLHDGDKLCPGKFADCKMQMLNMKGNLQVDHFANKKISLIPLKCAAEYCQYRNTKLNMAKHIASHQLRPNADRSDIGGDREQSPMFAIKDPLEYGIDCRMAMLAETIHNWRTEIGFMKDWADENRSEINDLITENINLKTEIGFLREEDDRKQATIDELVIQNRNLKDNTSSLKKEDDTKERIFKLNLNFQKEIATNKKLQQRIMVLEKGNKQKKIEIKQLKLSQVQDNTRSTNNIAKDKCNPVGKQLLPEDMSVERQNLEGIVKENERFAEKVKVLQQIIKDMKMMTEGLMIGNEDLKAEVTKYEKLCNRLKNLNMENRNKQDKIIQLRNSVLEGNRKTEKLLQINEEMISATKGDPQVDKGFCKSKSNIKREYRRKRNQACKLEDNNFVESIETEYLLESQLAIEREQFYQWYEQQSAKIGADIKTEMKKNSKFRETLKQLNIEKSKLKKFMRNFVTPDAVNTSDKVDSSEEEQLLADKASMANANLQVIAEKNKILLEKVHNLEADNKEKREEINKLRCMLIVQQYKSRANVGGQCKRSDCEWEDDGVIAPNDSSDQSDWLKNGHPIGNCVPFEWKIESLSKKIEDAKSDIVTEIFSEPFYSHENGYKLQLRLHPGGSGPGVGTHLSVFVGLLSGEYDDALSWPMTRPVAVALLNQKSKTFHVVHEYHHQFQLVDNDRPGAEFVGCPHFMSSVDVLSNKNLRKKDAIVLICFLV